MPKQTAQSFTTAPKCQNGQIKFLTIQACISATYWPLLVDEVFAEAAFTDASLILLSAPEY
jgi:hypothetical protein